MRPMQSTIHLFQYRSDLKYGDGIVSNNWPSVACGAGGEPWMVCETSLTQIQSTAMIWTYKDPGKIMSPPTSLQLLPLRPANGPSYQPRLPTQYIFIGYYYCLQACKCTVNEPQQRLRSLGLRTIGILETDSALKTFIATLKPETYI